MVLSNKKLKQKLRAEKAALLAASEAQINSTDYNPEKDSNLKPQDSLNSLLDALAQKPRFSKREKRREKGLYLQDNAQNSSKSDHGDGNKGKEEGGSEVVVEDKGKRKKRKRAEEKGLETEEVKEVKKLKKKKKKKKKKKGKKNVQNGEVKESIVNGDGGIGNQGCVDTTKNDDNLDACTKVYVGGIPYYSSEDDIRSYFEGCGTITEIDCMTFPESGKFRGISIISFKTEAAAKRGLALDGSDMGGLFLKIQQYKSARISKPSIFSPAIVDGYNRIYVGNLSWDVTEEDLRKLFSGCNITSIRFGEDKETGEFRGYAHVDFADNNSLNIALKLDQKVVCGRPVRISCAVPKKGSVNKPQPMTETNPADGEGTTAVSGKIRRRTCYECGERGHLSSSCPKKSAADQVNPSSN